MDFILGGGCIMGVGVVLGSMLGRENTLQVITRL